MLHPFIRQYTKRPSDFYYAFRKVPSAQFAILAAIDSFAEEINAIAENSKEPSVAEAKLAWWHEEINRLFAGTPTHPISEALLAAIQSHALKAMMFQALIEASLLSIPTQIFTRQSELNQHYQHLGGILLSLLAAVLAPASPSEKPLHFLGISNEIIRHLNHFAHFLKRSQLYLPLDLLAKHKIQPQAILQNADPVLVSVLLKEEARRARDYYDQALKELTPEDKKTLRPILNYCRLQQKLLDKMEDAGFLVLHTRFELSALSKLWYTLF